MKASNKTRQELPTLNFAKAFISVVSKFDQESSYNVGLTKITTWFKALNNSQEPLQKLHQLSQLANAGYTLVQASGAIDQLLDLRANCLNQPNVLTLTF